jgi:hypothetical protein
VQTDIIGRVASMKKLAILMAVAAALGVSGCVGVGSDTSPSALPTLQSSASTADPCAAAATQYNGQVTRSFVTTIGAILAVPMLHIQSGRWPGLANSHTAVLCYIDGQIPMGPPPPASGSIPPSFDRAVIVVIDGQIEPLMAGYRDQVPIVAP